MMRGPTMCSVNNANSAPGQRRCLRQRAAKRHLPQRPCPKSRLGELGTEPVAVATGCFQRDYPLATASGSVPDRLTDTRILSCEAKSPPKTPKPALAGDRFEWFHPA